MCSKNQLHILVFKNLSNVLNRLPAIPVPDNRRTGNKPDICSFWKRKQIFKSPIFVPFGGNLAQFEAKSDIPDTRIQTGS